jgi:hypothetical protein
LGKWALLVGLGEEHNPQPTTTTHNHNHDVLCAVFEPSEIRSELRAEAEAALGSEF